MKTTFFDTVFLSAGLIISGASLTKAAVIANWSFETSAPTTAGPISPEVGSGSALASGLTIISSPSGNGTAHSFSGNGWNSGDYFQFSANTLGYTGISIQWDQTGSGTGPRDFVLQYSLTANSGYSQIGSAYFVSLITWGSTTPASGFTYTPDLSSISSSIDNFGTVYFRLVNNSSTAINLPAVQTTGTDRIDNFMVSGNISPVPEPVNVAIAVFGVLVVGTGGVRCYLKQRKVISL